MKLLAKLQAGFEDIRGVTIHGTRNLERRVATISITIANLDPGKAGTFLDVDYGVQTRTGLQCAPLIHEHHGTTPHGTIRFSLGPWNTEAHVLAAVRAVGELAAQHASDSVSIPAQTRP